MLYQQCTADDLKIRSVSSLHDSARARSREVSARAHSAVGCIYNKTLSRGCSLHILELVWVSLHDDAVRSLKH
jgi:hypothetical protein